MEKYKMIKLIGCGSYSDIYLIKDIFNNNFVMKKLFINDDNEINSCKIINDFKDPNILMFYELIDNKIIYEFFEGDHFNKNIHNLSIDNFIKILKYLVKTLLNLENNGYYHFDIKEDNILINNKNEIKLIDYGFLNKFNKKIDLVGSYGYQAPEYYLDNILIPEKFDVFSIGILIFKYFFNFNPMNKTKNYKLKCWYWCKNDDCNRDNCLKEYLNKNLNEYKKYFDLLTNTINFDHKKRWNLKELYNYLNKL